MMRKIKSNSEQNEFRIALMKNYYFNQRGSPIALSMIV